MHYLGPDELARPDPDQGYADWLHAALAGAPTRFYDTLRWPCWQADVAALGLDQGAERLSAVAVSGGPGSVNGSPKPCHWPS